MKTKQFLESFKYKTIKYSGRGMMGTHCLAVVTRQNPIHAIWDIAAQVGQSNLGPIGYPRYDTLGMDYVIYWPNTPYEE